MTISPALQEKFADLVKKKHFDHGPYSLLQMLRERGGVHLKQQKFTLPKAQYGIKVTMTINGQTYTAMDDSMDGKLVDKRSGCGARLLHEHADALHQHVLDRREAKRLKKERAAMHKQQQRKTATA